MKRKGKDIPNGSGPVSSRKDPDLLQGVFREDAPDMLRLETMVRERGYDRVAGIDEAGRGPLAGPVVAAAVIFPPGILYEGLTDSKLLTPVSRDRWFDQIRETALAYSIASVDQAEIDKINILQATLKAMKTAVKGLALSPDFLLIDGITPLQTRIPQQCVKKGDRRSQSIAAASVLAKVTRDRLMDEHHETYPRYNFKKNKGYGTLEHREAIRRFGSCPLHRRSFRGVEDREGPGDEEETPSLF